MSDLEAFTLALRLSVTAPTDELAEGPLQIAQELSRRLTAKQVNQAKSIIELETAQGNQMNQDDLIDLIQVRQEIRRI